MSSFLLAQSLDTWNPLTTTLAICLSIYVGSQSAVMVIRALRGDNKPTGLETQIGSIISRVARVEQTTGDIAKDFVPPEAFDSMLKGKVLEAVLDLQKNRAKPPQAATTTSVIEHQTVANQTVENQHPG